MTEHLILGVFLVLPLLIVAPNNGTCGNYATKPVAGCSAHYGSQPAYQPERSPALRALTNYLVGR